MKKAFQSSLCVILSILLLLPAAVMAAAKQSEAPLSVWVASDIHYRPQSMLGLLREQNTLPGDPLYAHVNDKGMLVYEADAVINEFLSRFEKSSAKYLLIPGDISQDGYWDEHLGIARILRDFMKRTGKKIFLIPGNHDIRTSASNNRLNLSDFLEIYADIGYNEVLTRHEGSASYTAELDDGYRLIAIDACVYREDGSRMTPDLLNWIEAQVKQAKRDGKKLIAMVHHNMLEHFGIENIAGNMLCLDNYRQNASKFADWGIQYVFTGHEHANDISMAVSDKGNKIYDVETDSLITYPNAYREVSFSGSAVNVKTEYIDHVNLSDLPDGFNQQQLALMQNDFPAYSLGYFRASIKRVAYDIPAITKRIAGPLKIKEGSPQYEVFSTVMNITADALKLPLYDKAGTPAIDSVEEFAKEAGLTIEPSDYTNALDIIGDIYARHYAGDENLTCDSPEITLLKQSFNAVLVYALANIPSEMANTLFESLGLQETNFVPQEDSYTQAAKMIYMRSAAKIVFNEFMKPLLDSFITDSFSPGDLNVTLESYGTPAAGIGTIVAITDFSFAIRIIYNLINTALNAVKALSAV